MINGAITLKGNIDAKYANFFLSLLEEKQHNSLLTDEIVQEFRSGSYDYPDEFLVTGIPKNWTKSEDWNEVFQLLRHIEKTLSYYLRKSYCNNAIYPMEKNYDFNSVFGDMAESILFGLNDSRPLIEIEMPLDCWNLLKRVCNEHQNTWMDTLKFE